MKDKKFVIGALLAILIVMAVGYSAFSTVLTINGTASINSNWNVAFDTTKTSDVSGVITKTTGFTGGTAPDGSVSYGGNGQTATVNATLRQPGDKVVFKLTIQNKGTLAANLGTPSVSGTNCSAAGLTCTSSSGHIKFTVTNPTPTSLAASTGTSTITVTAEFPNTAVSSSTTENASIKVTLNATQA